MRNSEVWLWHAHPARVFAGGTPIPSFKIGQNRHIRFRRGFKSEIFAIALLMLLFPFISPCYAQNQLTLRRVEFVGLKKLSQQQAIDTSGLKIGTTVTPAIIDAAAEKLMASGLFRKLGYKLRTTDADATVIFEVEELSRNLPVVFENFVWFT